MKNINIEETCMMSWIKSRRLEKVGWDKEFVKQEVLLFRYVKSKLWKGRGQGGDYRKNDKWWR